MCIYACKRFSASVGERLKALLNERDEKTDRQNLIDPQ